MFYHIISCLLSGYYNITNARGKVARFCLFKQAFRIGDDIVGTCDFTENTIPCAQVGTATQPHTICSDYIHQIMLKAI